MLKEFRGGASRLDLTSDITAASTSIAVAGASLTNWPTGTIGPFVIRIEDELILCSDRVAETIHVSQRGWDATGPASHVAASGVVRHVIDADTLADIEGHIYKSTRDDHPQYLKTDGSRPLTDVSGMTGPPVPLGTTLQPGATNLMARSDHVHTVPNNLIVNAMIADNAIAQRHLADNVVGSAELADGAVDAAALQTGAVIAGKLSTDAVSKVNLTDASVGTNELENLAVTSAKLAAGAVDQSKLASGLRVPVVCTSTTRPASPTEGDAIYETDTDKHLTWNGTSWCEDYDLGAYDDWTPAIGAQGGSPAFGAGSTVFAKVRRRGQQIHAIFHLTLGAGVNFGTGALFISVPTAIASTWPEVCLGSGIAKSNAASTRWVLAVAATNPTFVFFSTYNGNPVSGSVNMPFTWTTGDMLSYNITYEAQ